MNTFRHVYGREGENTYPSDRVPSATDSHEPALPSHFDDLSAAPSPILTGACSIDNSRVSKVTLGQVRGDDQLVWDEQIQPGIRASQTTGR